MSYVRFNYDHIECDIGEFPGFDELNRCRTRLLDLRLLGMDGQGVGFGNLSVREGQTNNFYITGSGTGSLTTLSLADCARVIAYDIARNWLRCHGRIVPSSESLSHAVIYEMDDDTGAVIHCHHQTLWRALLHKVPTTPVTAEYGTPALGAALQQLFRATDIRSLKIVAMAGHEGGLLTFGRNLADAFAVLQRYFNSAEPDRKYRRYL
jgi:ribulose-5-phosphate 4-epimerase/fuculose-1-phosphate aldolase